MNAQIQFLKDTSKAVIEDIKPNTLLVYYDGYAIPKIDNIQYMTFERFKAIYSELDVNMIIFVGLNRMITPSNRCDMVNDYMQTMTRQIPKISIDTAPFIGEPWRLWYHYDVTNNSELFGVPHGFAIETEWKYWFYREHDICKLDSNELHKYVKPTYSDLDLLTTKFIFNPVTEQGLTHYEEVKKHVFETYNSPKLWVNNILKLINKHYNLDIKFESYTTNKCYNIPDLKIYRFIVEENNRRLNIYNKVIRL